MAKCRHRWQLRDVRAPFSGLVVCEVCHAIVRASLVSGAGQSTMRLEVLSYGHQGVGLEDLESVLVWLQRQLQLGRLKEPASVAPARAMRHKRKNKAA